MRIVHRRSRDLQREAPAALCSRGGGELYRGSPCWLVGGRRLCEECVSAWLLEEMAPFRVFAGEVER